MANERGRQRKPTGFTFAVGALGLTGLASSHARAQTAIWNGGDGAASDPTRWSGGTVPNDYGNGTSHDVFIDKGNPISSHVLLDGTMQFNTLNISSGDVVSGNLLLTGGMTNNG